MLREIGIREGADRKGHAGHHQDEDAADHGRPVQLALALDGHEPDDQLRLGQDADTHPHDDRRDDEPPQVVLGIAETERRHGGPSVVADGLEVGRHQVRQVRQRPVALGDASHLDVGVDEEDAHAHEHDDALEGVGVHDALQAAGYDVGRRDDGKDQEGRLVVDLELLGNEERAADEHGRRIQRHEEEDHQPREDLDEPALVPPAQELRKRVGVEMVAHAADAAAQEHERDEDADEDVQEGEPQAGSCRTDPPRRRNPRWRSSR